MTDIVIKHDYVCYDLMSTLQIMGDLNDLAYHDSISNSQLHFLPSNYDCIALLFKIILTVL